MQSDANNIAGETTTDQWPRPPSPGLLDHVKSQWDLIDLGWRNGAPSLQSIALLDEAIENRRQDIANGRLDSRFDWEGELIEARMYHYAMRDTLSRRETINSDIRLFWSGYIQRQDDLIKEITVSGLKIMVTIHGAVGLASLAVLSGQVERPTGPALVASIIALAGSLAGLLATGLGHVLIVEGSLARNDAIRPALSALTKNRRLYAIGRFVRMKKARRLPRVGVRLVYASMLTFAAYAIVCSLILAS